MAPTKPQVVIAMYRPKPGKGEYLEAIVRRHVPTLRAAGLATKRPGTLLRSFKDGTLLEIFEWESLEAAQKAHDHPQVSEIWGAMEKAASFVSLSQLTEAGHPFPHFDPVNGVVV